MQSKIEKRLQDLRQEFEAGQKMLAELDAQRNTIQQTILRISGAIQVLEELLDGKTDDAAIQLITADTVSLDSLTNEPK